MTEWKEYKLGEIASFKTGKLNSNAAVENGIYPFFTCSPITYAINEYAYNQKAILLAGNNAEGNFSVKYYEGKFNAYQRTYIIESNKGICDLKFLYYSLKLCLQEFKHISQGTSTKFLTSVILNNFSISLPPLPEQIRIASILSSLDDKIDLLHRENKTLEAMAETLFRQWFIEEAKEDWKEGTIADFAEHYKASVNPRNNPIEMYYHYSIPAFDTGKEPILEQGENIQSNKYLVPKNCILFSKLNPHRDKRVWIMLDDIPDNAICSTEFQIVKPTNLEYLYFLYGWLTNKENYDEIASGVGGTSGSHQRIDPKTIFSYSCPQVDMKTIRNYNKCVESLFYKQRNNQQQIQTLIQQRDSLLPKLMSGEVKI